jgi:hypothetical protein
MKRFYALPMALAMLALVVSVSLATSALAQPSDHGPNHLARFAEHLNRRLELLDLSDSQRSTVQTLLRAHTKCRTMWRRVFRSQRNPTGSAAVQGCGPCAPGRTIVGGYL